MKKELGVDKYGTQRVMRKRDYLADFSGSIGMAMMMAIVSQLTYFYTDKVGLSVAGVGVILMIVKIVDAFTDVIAGHFIDHSKGGNMKYYKWILWMSIPAGAIMILVFTVPIQAGQAPALAYALFTNFLFTAVIYTLLQTPFSAVMVVRTNSQSERSSMGILRAAGTYLTNSVIVMITIPVTNMLGGTQSAWVKYGVVLGLIMLLLLLICYNNGRKALSNQKQEDEVNPIPEQEEEAVAFKEAIGMLFRNKYWLIVLLYNLISNIYFTISGMSTPYYTKWIFGNDNLIAISGMATMVAAALGFLAAPVIINKLGIKRTIFLGLICGIVSSAVRCFIPTDFTVYVATFAVGQFLQVPQMSLVGVLLAMSVDYNEWKYDKRLVAISSGVVGFGNKVGGGLGSVLLSVFLTIGAYDATLPEATASMRYSIYGFTNYLPIVIYVILLFVFSKYDLEEKLPAMKKEIAARRAAQKAEE